MSFNVTSGAKAIPDILAEDTTQTGPSPSIKLVDNTGAEEDFLILVDAGKVNMRDNAGIDNDLIVLDLANKRVGLGKSPGAFQLDLSSTLNIVGAVTAGSSVDVVGALTSPGGGANSFKAGGSASANGVGSVAVGDGAKADTQWSVSIGLNASNAVAGQGAVSIGRESDATGSNTVAVGNVAQATATNAIGLGNTANASASAAIAIGDNTVVAGTSAIAIGSGAQGAGASSVAIGIRAGQATIGAQAVAIGPDAEANGGSSIAIGLNAGDAVLGANSIVIGVSSDSTSTNSIAIGNAATATAANQFVSGSSTAPITNIYFGEGVTSTTASAYTMNGTGGSGTDNAGANVILAAGKGTGTGVGGDLLFQTATAGSTSSTPNALATRLQIDDVSGNAAFTSASNSASDIFGLTITSNNAGAGVPGGIDMSSFSLDEPLLGTISDAITTAGTVSHQIAIDIGGTIFYIVAHTHGS